LRFDPHTVASTQHTGVNLREGAERTPDLAAMSLSADTDARTNKSGRETNLVVEAGDIATVGNGNQAIGIKPGGSKATENSQDLLQLSPPASERWLVKDRHRTSGGGGEANHGDDRGSGWRKAIVKIRGKTSYRSRRRGLGKTLGPRKRKLASRKQTCEPLPGKPQWVGNCGGRNSRAS